jgi:RimJ/RimL family protein N-acetyltransferase
MFEVYEDWYRNHPIILQTPGSMLRQSRKGRTFNIRQLEKTDAGLLADFMGHLSPVTLWLRFFVPYPALSGEAISQEIIRLNQIGKSDGVVLVGTRHVDGQEEIIAVGEMIPDKDVFSTAEIALTVRDDYQGEGIGSAMAIQLVQAAAKKGISILQAEALVQNLAMLRIWRKLGLPYDFCTRQSTTTMQAWLDQ